MWDLGEYQKGRIWESTRNVGFGRVPEMWDLGEYQKCGIWASTRKVGSGQVPEKEKFGRVPEKVGSRRVLEM